LRRAGEEDPWPPGARHEFDNSTRRIPLPSAAVGSRPKMSTGTIPPGAPSPTNRADSPIPRQSGSKKPRPRGAFSATNPPFQAIVFGTAICISALAGFPGLEGSGIGMTRGPASITGYGAGDPGAASTAAAVRSVHGRPRRHLFFLAADLPAKCASNSSSLTHPSRWNWIVSNVRFVGLRPVRSTISRLMISAAYICSATPLRF
jgi:hypothetical protein